MRLPRACECGAHYPTPHFAADQTDFNQFATHTPQYLASANHISRAALDQCHACDRCSFFLSQMERSAPPDVTSRGQINLRSQINNCSCISRNSFPQIISHEFRWSSVTHAIAALCFRSNGMMCRSDNRSILFNVRHLDMVEAGYQTVCET
jgi:hypothetical protein